MFFVGRGAGSMTQEQATDIFRGIVVSGGTILINIELMKFFRDHTWFGWHVSGITVFAYTSEVPLNEARVSKPTYKWSYSCFWSDRLWPMRRTNMNTHYNGGDINNNYQYHKKWWLKVFPAMIK